METYELKNLDCADCAAKIEDALRDAPGVSRVSVDFATLSLRIEAADMADVEKRIRAVEPDVRLGPRLGSGAERGRKSGEPDRDGRFRLSRELFILGLGAVFFILGMVFEERMHGSGLPWLEYAVFGAAYLLAGWNVLVSAVRSLVKGRVFGEHFLMTVATGGAFAIHAIAEAVGVMIFYKVGEILQSLAVQRSRRSIRSLLMLRPDSARVARNGGFREVKPEEVEVGETVSVRPGERVPLDGTVLSGTGFMDTSAMTGEPVPRRAVPGDAVLAGYINTDGSLLIRVDKTAGESSAAKIVELVEEAAHAKARTELFITRFARVYTPLVVAGAALVAFLPPLLVPGAALSDWAYRALVMLVISCPCALVVSVPLGYFGGIGGSSRRGILVKGARHLDALAAVRTVVFDKTGTLTRGVFKVMEVKPANGMGAEELLRYAALAEAHSNHPIAASIREAYGRDGDHDGARDYREVGGMGVSADVSGKSVVVGNDIFMHREGIAHGSCEVGGTVVHVAVDRLYAGYLVIGDELKHDAGKAIRELRDLGIDRTVLLTGDSTEVAASVAAALGMDEFHGNLLPADKVAALERVMRERSRRGKTAFVGDGINDAPVLARSDVGIAMGRSGSDAAVESADVVLMTDSPARVSEAVRRARRTRTIVVENIVLALAVKAGFLALGGAGLAGMWEAVIADMGVTLVAVLNAARAMR